MADTVSVNLRRRWFAPNGSAYEPEDNPHAFPAAWADKPKKREDESKEDFEAREKSSKYEVLPTTAEVLGETGGRTVMTERLTANGTPMLDVQTVDEDVKSVGNVVDEVPEARSDERSKTMSVSEAAKAAKDAGVTAGGNPRVSGPQSGKKQ